MVASGGTREGKQSFFEKKDQKTFLFDAVATTSRVHLAPSCPTSEETKVFWSFFSKKDCFLLPILLLWAPHASAQSLSLNMAPDGAHSLTTNVVTLVAITSVLSLAPGLLVMGTAFTRLVVVLSLLRTALGLQQTPPNTVIIALSLFLTGFIMAPSFETAYRQAVQPLMAGSITEEQAFDRGVKPFRGFMEANASDRDVALFIDLAHWTPPPPPAPRRPPIPMPQPCLLPSRARCRAPFAPN
jgi:flagellar biosynthesis protein FliP